MTEKTNSYEDAPAANRPTLNAKMFRAIAREIDCSPGDYDQTQPYGALNMAADPDQPGYWNLYAPNDADDGAECCSACCVAGWAYFMTHAGTETAPDETESPWPDGWETQHAVAKQALGLTDEEAALLFCSYWPTEWYPAAGLELTADDLEEIEERIERGFSAKKQPEPEEAIAILEWIADHGKLPPTADHNLPTA